MDGWDWALLIIGGYVAVVTLTRMMLARRDEVLSEAQQEIQRERLRQKKKAKAEAQRKAT